MPPPTMPTMVDMKAAGEKLDALIGKIDDVIQQIADVLKPYPQNQDEDIKLLMGDYEHPEILALADRMKKKIWTVPQNSDLQIMHAIMGELTDPFRQAGRSYGEWLNQSKLRLSAQRKVELGKL
jgi:ATP phosphoribosyltransferase